MIITPKIEAYLHHLTPLQHPLLKEMEAFATIERIPIIDRSSIQFIRFLLQLKEKVEHILEVGTAIGYSTIWLAEAVDTAFIDTIERDVERVDKAKQFIERASLSSRITIHQADALEDDITNLQSGYDVIFIDAAKGQYQQFFNKYVKLLNRDGIVLTDNVFFHGHVVEDELANKRWRPMVDKIKSFNEWLKQHEEFETSFLPIGDGLALTKRKNSS